MTTFWLEQKALTILGFISSVHFGLLVWMKLISGRSILPHPSEQSQEGGKWRRGREGPRPSVQERREEKKKKSDALGIAST